MILRKALFNDLQDIWMIIQAAIERRKREGSEQWQDGYPNENTLKNDIALQQGMILEDNNHILSYAAVIFENDPDYDYIEGNWLNDEKYAVIHRVATSNIMIGKGMATKLFLLIEDHCLQHNISNIRVDTNFDNHSMLHILAKLNYIYCGQVYLRGAARRAYHKILKHQT